MTYRWRVCSGCALLVGSALIAAKSLSILATGYQPPWLFEASPFFFAIGVLGLAPALDLSGTRRSVVLGLGLVALVSAATALVTELTGEVLGAALGVATLAGIGGTLVSGWRPGDDRTKRSLVLVPISVVPALLVGGILEMVNERLLEIGLLGYALVWAWAGFRLVRG